MKSAKHEAWAVIGRTGKVLRDLRGHYGIYTHKTDAVADCPAYGNVKRVSIRVVKDAP